MAQSERFELPSHGDTGFQIRRNTRLCDDCFGSWEALGFFCFRPYFASLSRRDDGSAAAANIRADKLIATESEGMNPPSFPASCSFSSISRTSAVNSSTRHLSPAHATVGSSSSLRMYVMVE